MTIITRAAQLASTAVSVIGAFGASGMDAASPEFTRAVSKFTGADPVFTRAISTRAEDGTIEGGQVENVKVEDGEAKSFDAIASRGTRRLMWHPVLRRVVHEELVITSAGVDLSGVEAQRGIPFFRDHYHWHGAQLGRVMSLEVSDGLVMARDIRLSRHDDVKRYRMDLADGLTVGVSLGYRHAEYTVIEQEGDYPICRVTKIIPVELSATDMPADILCGIVEASIRSGYPNDDAPETAVIAATPAPAGGETATRAATTQENVMSTTPSGAPAGNDPVVTRSDAPVTPPANPLQAPTFDAAAFATRSAEMVTIARQSGIADDVLTRSIADPAVTVDAFRSQGYASFVAKQTPNVSAGNDVATRGNRDDAMVQAIIGRATGKPLEGLATEYARHSLAELALDFLHSRGETQITRHDRNALYTRAMHVTSDFGDLLTKAATKILVNMGNDDTQPFRTIARKMDLSNFQETKMVDFDNFPRLKRLAEGGEIRAGTFGGGEYSAQLDTYWAQLLVSRRMFVNDGFGVFSNILSTTATTIPSQQNDLVFFALLSEAARVLSGGQSKALIPGVNLLPNNTDLDDAGLDQAVTAMLSRKRRDGGRSGLKPKFLIHGPLLRTKAIRQTTAVVANATGEINVNTGLVPVMDANIPGRTWFLTTDPAQGIPALAYGGLEGEQSVMTNPWERVRGVDGYQCEVGMDFHGTIVSSHAIVGSLDEDAFAI